LLKLKAPTEVKYNANATIAVWARALKEEKH